MLLIDSTISSRIACMVHQSPHWSHPQGHRAFLEAEWVQEALLALNGEIAPTRSLVVLLYPDLQARVYKNQLPPCVLCLLAYSTILAS